MSSSTFTSGEVSCITGLSLRQLQWWDEQHILSPNQEGHRRMYSERDLVMAILGASLRRAGVGLSGRFGVRSIIARYSTSIMEHYLEGRRSFIVISQPSLRIFENPGEAIGWMATRTKPCVVVETPARVVRAEAEAA